MQLEPGDIRRSWQTRMESVARQFLKLAAAPVMDRDKDQMVHICGMFLAPMPDDQPMVRVSVVPTDASELTYSTSLDNLEL